MSEGDVIKGLVLVDAAAADIQKMFDDGRPLDAVKRALELGLDLLPVEELRGYLDDAARAKADALVDIAERAKVGP